MSELSGIAPEDAKLKFLTEVHKMDTFGSAFFEVRQTTDPNLPQRILVAIMKRGIVIIDPVTKKPLIEYGYAKISNWSCGETYFTLQVGSLIRASKLICETTLGKFKIILILNCNYCSRLQNGKSCLFLHRSHPPEHPKVKHEGQLLNKLHR